MPFVRPSAVDLSLHCLLVFLLLRSAPADVIQKITTYANKTAILPCYITPSDDLPTVEWSKEDISPNITFLYRDGCETFAEKNPLFNNRTNIPLNKVKDGDLSLIIHDMRLSDAGVYLCLTRTGRQVQVEATLELFVVAVSEPKLTFLPADDGMMLQCKAECWFPEPQAVFLDDQGSEIEAKRSQRDEDPTGCFTITRTVSLKVATSSVTCKVHQAQSNQTRMTRLHIPGSCMSSGTNVWVMAGGIIGGIIVALIMFGCVCRFNLLKKNRNPVCECSIKNGTPSRNQDGDVGQLKQKDKENETNYNPNENNFRSSSELSPQFGQPPIICISPPPSTSLEDQLSQSQRISPNDMAAFSNPASPSTPEGSPVRRSSSFSRSSFRSSRRLSPYSVMEKVTEDKESLLNQCGTIETN